MKEVATLFNSVCNGVVINPLENEYFDNMYQNNNEYSAKHKNHWSAMLIRDYLSNPWSIIGLFAASLLLYLVKTDDPL